MKYKNGRFLIIVENDDYRHAITALLLSQYPFLKIQEATTGQQAFNNIGKSKPDVVVIDVSAKVKSNLSLIEKLRKALPHALFFSMSIENGYEYEKAAKNRGSDHHFFISDLNIYKIGELLERTMLDAARSSEKNRRKHIRYKANYPTPVHLRSESGKIYGQLLDISEGGLSLTFFAYNHKRAGYFELEIHPPDNAFAIEGIRFRIVSDMEVLKAYPYGSRVRRRIGVQFSKLVPEQKTRLDRFFRNYTSEEI